MEKINHPGLVPGMERVRSGSTMLFRVKPEGCRSFLSRENSDVIIEAPEKHMYAKEIEGEWFWVNGCSDCDPEQSYYIRCVKHNVCKHCKCNPEDAVEKWGANNNGWLCLSCKTKEEDNARKEAFDNFDEENYSPTDFHYESEVTCPYCGIVDEYFEPENINFDNKVNRTCGTCQSTYSLTVSMSVDYSTDRILPKDES